jgi:hypothetical protein
VIQIELDPPNTGRIIFEASGCTRNNRQALLRIVAPNSAGAAPRPVSRSFTASICWFAIAADDIGATNKPSCYKDLPPNPHLWSHLSAEHCKVP